VRRAIARAFSVAALAIGIYVAYAHVASWRTIGQYTEQPIALRFDGARWAVGFDVRSNGVILPVVEGGRLALRGPSSAPRGTLANVEVAGPVRRLRDVALSMRFRVHNAADFDLSVGLERADASALDRSRVEFGLRNRADHPSYRFFGDERAEMPRVGDSLGRQRYVPFEAPDVEHEVTLRVSPDLNAMLASVDGVPVSSHLAGWDDGVAVRPILTLRAREPGQVVEAEVLQFDYVPLPRETRPIQISEHFDGRVLDPSEWRVLRADGWSAQGDLSFLSGGGIRLQGRGLRPMNESPLIGLVANTVPLGSFRASMRFSIEHLQSARLYFSFSNLLFGLADWRTFEVGLVDGATQRDAFAAGHWEGDGQFAATALPGVASGVREGTLAIEFDAATGFVVATLDGRLLTKQRLDFQPPELAHLELGIRALDGHAEADVRIFEVTLEPRAWSATPDAANRWAPPPSASGEGVGFFDDFSTDSSDRYHLLRGTAAFHPDAQNVQLGPDAPNATTYSELARGFFDAPVTVSGSVFVPDDPARGDDDSVGVMAVDHDGATRYLAVLWYGRHLKPELHLVRQTDRGDSSLASSRIEIFRGKSYWVKLFLDRHNAYARAWPNDGATVEPSEWMLMAPLEDGWTASGGVGFAANATKTWGTALRAE
jgi:hypothetical protein